MEPLYLFFIGIMAISLAQSLCALTCLVRIFMKGDVGIGCACFIPVAGPLILFFYSWSKAEEWEQQRLMVAYSLTLALSILFGGVWFVLMLKTGLLGGR